MGLGMRSIVGIPVCLRPGGCQEGIHRPQGASQAPAQSHQWPCSAACTGNQGMSMKPVVFVIDGRMGAGKTEFAKAWLGKSGNALFNAGPERVGDPLAIGDAFAKHDIVGLDEIGQFEPISAKAGMLNRRRESFAQTTCPGGARAFAISGHRYRAARGNGLRHISFRTRDTGKIPLQRTRADRVLIGGEIIRESRRDARTPPGSHCALSWRATWDASWCHAYCMHSVSSQNSREKWEHADDAAARETGWPLPSKD